MWLKIFITSYFFLMRLLWAAAELFRRNTGVLVSTWSIFFVIFYHSLLSFISFCGNWFSNNIMTYRIISVSIGTIWIWYMNSCSNFFANIVSLTTTMGSSTVPPCVSCYLFLEFCSERRYTNASINSERRRYWGGSEPRTSVTSQASQMQVSIIT